MKFCTRTFHKIAFAHTKFGSVRIKGSGAKGGGGREADSAPRSERVFKILVRIGLKGQFHLNDYGQNLANALGYSLACLFFKNLPFITLAFEGIQTSFIFGKHVPSGNYNKLIP